MIPQKYTCEGEDISPPLRWSDVPQGTKSLALICDDPDAPMLTWVHWVVYCMSPTTTELKEGQPTKDVIDGAVQGVNSWRRRGYGGPCPPGHSIHRYFFKLYALDVDLQLRPGTSKKDLEKVMAGHMLAEAQLMGVYTRS